MMSLEELWDENPPGPVLYAGRWVHRADEFNPTGAASFHIKVIKCARKPLQGVGLIARNCKLKAGEAVGKDFVMWAKDLRRVRQVEVVDVRDNASVIIYNIYNAWGRIDAWLRNSGMIIEELSDNSFQKRAYCSDGFGDADFNDLIFDYSYFEGGAQSP